MTLMTWVVRGYERPSENMKLFFDMKFFLPVTCGIDGVLLRVAEWCKASGKVPGYVITSIAQAEQIEIDAPMLQKLDNAAIRGLEDAVASELHRRGLRT